MRCPLCASSNMRVSRFRFSDLPRLLLCQHPVRCRNCHERDYANLFVAWRLPRRHGKTQPLFVAGTALYSLTGINDGFFCAVFS